MPTRPLKRFAGTGLLLALACHGSPTTSSTDNDPSPHTVRFIAAAPGVLLEVLDWGGHGLPLVFLSGLQDVAHGFDDFAPQFTDRYHVLAITRRGYGASAQPPSGYDLNTRVADLRAVLDSMALSRVVLVGHSIAGDELTAFGGIHPDRVAGLIYLDAAYDHSGVAALLVGYPAPPPMTPTDSASPEGVRAYFLRVSGQHFPLAQLRAIGHYDSTGHLRADVTPARIDSLMLAGSGHPDYRRLKAPVLAIDAVTDSAAQLFPLWPTFDGATRSRAAAFTQALQAWAAAQRESLTVALPAAQLVQLHGANHYVFDSHRAETTQLMRTWLARLEADLGLLRALPPRHSSRSARTGSMVAARRAGRYEASAATASRTTGTPANVMGSVALTPTR